MTRLDYGGNTSSDWNNRPRALHNFCEYMNSAYETDAANWQIVTLESQPEAWHDAPILCITGSRAFTMDDDQIAKLRTYVNQGGTIFAIAECGGQPFAKSFKDICTKMFPKYEMTPCTGEHRLALPSGSGPTDAKFSEISNGVRPLVIFTDADLTLAWQTKAKTTMKSSFTRASDVIQYVTAMQFKNRGMGDWPIEAKLPENPKTIKVARVAFNGNCDPEPLAWQRFSRLMAAKYQIKVDVTEPIAIANLKDSKANLAVFYGTNKLELSAEEKTALKEFVDAGGKILFDSAGGSAKFYDSSQKIVDEIWGANNTPVLAPNDPIYKLPNMEIDRVYYRKLTTSRMGKTKDPQLMALKISDKPAVMLSREDITSGLLGIPIFTCDGYESERAIVNDTTKKKEKFESAFQMMRNIVVSAGG